MDRKGLRIARVACVCVLAAITAYAFVRLYVLSERADFSILMINVVLFTVVGGVLIFLTKKERDLEREKMFGD